MPESRPGVVRSNVRPAGTSAGPAHASRRSRSRERALADRADQAHRHGRVAQAGQVGAARVRERGVGGELGPRGQAQLGDPHRRDGAGPAEPVLGGPLLDAVDGEPERGAGDRPTGDRHLHGGGGTPLPARPQVHLTQLQRGHGSAVHGQADLRGHRVPPVGHHGDRQRRHGDGSGIGDLDPVAGRAVDRGLPGGGVVAVHRGGGPGTQVAGQACPRRGGQPTLCRGRQADQLVDPVVGQLGREAGLAVRGEGPGHRALDPAGHAALLVLHHHLGRVGRAAAEHVAEGGPLRCRAHRVQQVGRRADDLGGGTHPGHGDLGDAHVGDAGVAGQLTQVGVGDGDAQVVEGAAREGELLARRGTGGVGEGGVDGAGPASVAAAGAELQRDPGDPPVALLQRLQQRQAVGGDGLGEREVQVLVVDVLERADLPRRGRVAVHGVGGPSAGRVAHRVAVPDARAVTVPTCSVTVNESSPAPGNRSRRLSATSLTSGVSPAISV